MLLLLRVRCRAAAPDIGYRLRTHHTDALSYLAGSSSSGPYDLLVTHFFLDCLSQSEVETLAAAAAARLAPGAVWSLSEFRIPSGAMRLPAKMLVDGLYLAFRILTGLRANRLPDHTSALTRAGFLRTSEHCSLFGVLSAELWTFEAPIAVEKRI